MHQTTSFAPISNYLLVSLLLIVALLIASCAEQPLPSARIRAKLTLTAVKFSALPGWQADNQGQAVVALKKSCGILIKKHSRTGLGLAGSSTDWIEPCAELNTIATNDHETARAFFERWFTPYAVNGNEQGLFTGYYAAELHGAWQRSDKYQTPIWQTPEDLITVNLNAFHLDLKSQRIVGKVVGHKLEPYDDRAAIAQNSLLGRAKPILWVDDPIAAFFMEVQGSGRITMDNGEIVTIGYDGQNGRPYTAIGRILAKEGSITKPVTMEKIRDWLHTHPDKAQTVLNLNQSVVFFRLMSNNEGAVGAEGVVLTPQRSMAIDPDFVPLGIPLWIETKEIKSLVIAQDTGGAIKGAVRGDLFWGFGPTAEASAGSMQHRGHYYLLLPKTIDVRELQ